MERASDPHYNNSFIAHARIHELIHSFIHWFIYWFIYWLIDWLIDWFIYNNFIETKKQILKRLQQRRTKFHIEVVPLL